MQFLNLSVRNLGVFDSRHDFDLSPVRAADGTMRNVTVISGHNGAGKSTLFQALDIALHGQLALGDQVTHAMYSKFLSGRLHRRHGPEAPSVCLRGGVALSFEYIDSGVPLRIQVERDWVRQSAKVSEDLFVFQNGDAPSVAKSDYQSWLNDLVPPGLSPLCFFDAERLDGLVGRDEQNYLLSETLQRLLGLDLLARLGSDLGRYVLTQSKGQLATQHLRIELLQHQSAVDDLSSQLLECDAKSVVLSEQESVLEGELAVAERRLAAEGGMYGVRRPVMQERLMAVQAQVRVVAEQLRDHSSELLPFVLVPELCRGLKEQLAHEVEMRRHQAWKALWEERVTHVADALQADAVWLELGIAPPQRQLLLYRLLDSLQHIELGDDLHEERSLHQLSDQDHERLAGWIAHALHTVPGQVIALGTKLRVLQEEARQLEGDLQRVPDAELLAPMHAQIAQLQQTLLETRNQEAALREQRGTLQFQHDERKRQLDRIAEQFHKAQSSERHVTLAERSQRALRAFTDAFIRQRLVALEEALLTRFNAVCQKDRLLTVVRIQPENFGIHLYGDHERRIYLSDLSAGERQLYGMAMLWALRQVSGRKLPLAIDTPLARLDAVHRARFIHDFLPAVSNQVILLATDAELHSGLLSEAEPYIARIYRLQFDADREETVIQWEGPPTPTTGIVLHLADRRKELAHDA